MSVHPVNWLPGSLSAALPFFAVQSAEPHKLYLRADDPNLYGVFLNGVATSPTVTKNSITKAANKGFNFYSAPWSIPVLPARDLGKRTQITSVDQGVFDYIHALYTLLGGATPVDLTNFAVVQSGWAKQYQIYGGSQYVKVGGTTYFGGQTLTNTEVNGVPTLTNVPVPLITDDFEYNGTQVTAYQLPYNTFWVMDTPLVISAVDNNNPGVTLYFTLYNGVAVLNGPNWY
jgi:hypothetical protein